MFSDFQDLCQTRDTVLHHYNCMDTMYVQTCKTCTCDYVHLYNFFCKTWETATLLNKSLLKAQYVFDFNKAFDTLIHIYLPIPNCVNNDAKKSSILKLIKGYHKAQFLAQICVCHIYSSVCKDQKHIKKKK